MHWLVEVIYIIHHFIICMHYVRGKTPLVHYNELFLIFTMAN
jgi:hypothetical protein